MATKKKVNKNIKQVEDPTIKYIPNTMALKLLKLKKQHNKICNVFIGENITETEKALFFSSNRDIDIGTILVHYKNEKINYATLLRDLGIAESISKANGAGWKKEIPTGMSHLWLDGLKERRKEETGKFYPRFPHYICILKTVKINNL